MDLSLLISTIITSTAALVAIIGGFLVSRVITLSGEKNSIQKKIREIDKELNIKKEMLESAKQVVEEEDIDDFVQHYAEDILFNKKSLEDILEEEQSINLNRDVIESTIDRILEISQFIKDKIKSTDDNYVLPTDFNEFIRDNKIKIDEDRDRSWYELIYDIILRHIPQKQPGILNVDVLSSISDIGYFKPILSSQEYNANVRKVKQLEEDIKVLEALMNAEQDMLMGYGKISGLWGGLAVLIYACIVGIIIPSFLLPYPIGYYDDSAIRILLIALFISELVVLFSYLGFSMYRLTKKDDMIE
ncbi:hypothetical protein Nther_2508 [Natranaerobius thermophilus JW/NM-WN-LF]|uniref:Uncharacterized protein n=1 Tax=Natranaerobius thermophilus (strain ATCC BAA-1301 / DSM 18059 / JW/NM-WN-LF) TaxID=457570 RepID=B2A1D3_NATTJ|nr:hypothetical protein Nther_2508 [Natranaerobius thermophilus JW/NM-WN-LF]